MSSPLSRETNNSSRFSNRSENYARFRPGYPSALFPFIEQQTFLNRQSEIVDIGSGTGLFAEPLLEKGYRVVCIEPNDDMRTAGEERLKKYPAFQSIGSTAEATGLPSKSVDLITMAQTFHWLDPVAARHECRRVLKPGGHVVLAWNRERNHTDFEKHYSALRDEYRIGEAAASRIDPVLISEFFSPETPSVHSFPNQQLLNFEALKGQLLSKSYIPLPGHVLYDQMITDLIKLFLDFNESGQVKIDYETVVYIGKMGNE